MSLKQILKAITEGLLVYREKKGFATDWSMSGDSPNFTNINPRFPG
jgi:hypothetical protein